MSQKIQSVLIPKIDQNGKPRNLNDAKKWIKDHNFKLTYYGKGVDITPNFYRFRQLSPNTKHKYIKTIKPFDKSKENSDIMYILYYTE